MTEKGAEEQVLAMERLRIFYLRWYVDLFTLLIAAF